MNLFQIDINGYSHSVFAFPTSFVSNSGIIIPFMVRLVSKEIIAMKLGMSVHGAATLGMGPAFPRIQLPRIRFPQDRLSWQCRGEEPEETFQRRCGPSHIRNDGLLSAVSYWQGWSLQLIKYRIYIEHFRWSRFIGYTCRSRYSAPHHTGFGMIIHCEIFQSGHEQNATVSFLHLDNHHL